MNRLKILNSYASNNIMLYYVNQESTELQDEIENPWL